MPPVQIRSTRAPFSAPCYSQHCRNGIFSSIVHHSIIQKTSSINFLLYQSDKISFVSRKFSRSMASSNDSSIDLDDDELYEVEEIIDVRTFSDGRKEYLVRWVGWASQWDTWEPETNLSSCRDLIDTFWRGPRPNSSDVGVKQNEATAKPERKFLNVKKEIESSEGKTTEAAASSVGLDQSTSQSSDAPRSDSPRPVSKRSDSTRSSIVFLSEESPQEENVASFTNSKTENRKRRQNRFWEMVTAEEAEKRLDPFWKKMEDGSFEVEGDTGSLYERVKRRRGHNSSVSPSEGSQVAESPSSTSSERKTRTLEKAKLLQVPRPTPVVNKSRLVEKKKKQDADQEKEKIDSSMATVLAVVAAVAEQREINRANSQATATDRNDSLEKLVEEVKSFHTTEQTLADTMQLRGFNKSKLQRRVGNVPAVNVPEFNDGDSIEDHPSNGANVSPIMMDTTSNDGANVSMNADVEQADAKPAAVGESDLSRSVNASDNNDGVGGQSSAELRRESTSQQVDGLISTAANESTTHTSAVASPKSISGPIDKVDNANVEAHPKLLSATLASGDVLQDLEKLDEEVKSFRSTERTNVVGDSSATTEIPTKVDTSDDSRSTAQLPPQKLPAAPVSGQWRPLKREDVQRKDGAKLIIAEPTEEKSGNLSAIAATKHAGKSSTVQPTPTPSTFVSSKPLPVPLSLLPPLPSSPTSEAAQTSTEQIPSELAVPELPLPISQNMSVGDFFKAELANQNRLDTTEKIITDAYTFEQACCNGDVEAVRKALLVAKKPNSSSSIDLNRRNASGDSLLMRICQLDCGANHQLDDIIELLARNGANLNVRNQTGDTALTMAVNRNQVCQVMRLLTLGAAINVPNCAGETPLMLACRKNSLRVIHLLLDYGADFNALSVDGCTAFDIAKEVAARGRGGHCAAILQTRFDKVMQGFDRQLRLILPSEHFHVVEPLFPLHCYSLNESNAFRIVFYYGREPAKPSPQLLHILAIARGRFIYGHQTDVRFWGTTPVESVRLNGVEQTAVTSAGKFLYSFWPIKQGVNDLIIVCNKDCKKSQHKLLIDAYSVRVEALQK